MHASELTPLGPQDAFCEEVESADNLHWLSLRPGEPIALLNRSAA
ncbi:hypothetical protein DNH61_04840 [Paenibacillus sambharensis]|uniref:Uncharacterized protein n=1 Tax=Paenibacillus sambharensis TaxID=1803190 RepID=A0A2W1LQ01_9BACL|nr:hypothetical protein DNH61_04840 [Paenibacillus sambharensis]